MAGLRLHGAGRPPSAVVYGWVVRPAPGDNGALSPGPRGREPVRQVLTWVKYERKTNSEDRSIYSFWGLEY